MQTIHYPAAQRGHVNFGWLDSHHSFSFGNWHHRDKVHFGALRVLNDDTLKGGQGFDSQPIGNMEIITIPLKGALSHQDSTGAQGILYTGDVQLMSTGSGISYSGYNASHYDPVTLLQLWIFPKQPGGKPRYDRQSFDPAKCHHGWQIVVSPREEDQALGINQDARLALTRLDAGETISWHPAFTGNGTYLFVLEGQIAAHGCLLDRRDGLGITTAGSIPIDAITPSELLAIEVPMFA